MRVTYFRVEKNEYPLQDFLTAELWVREDKNSGEFIVMHPVSEYIEDQIELNDWRVSVNSMNLNFLSDVFE